MGFFEEQDRARSATVRLVVLYALAVIAIVAAANAMLVPVYYYSSGAHPKWSAFAVVTAATLAVIALGSLEIVARLSIGEEELATMLAGRRVQRGSPDEAERRLLNVVDEMAIASGLAAPPVYVLGREKAINAFAAGRSPNQAIVVVTAGALENLSRDELQAVIAHEFSHIINGDIALNLRGACVLQGIVCLYAIGRFVLSQLKEDDDRALLFWAYLPIGVAFYVIGWIGLPLTRWIQGAISREREYLADASAVRFTRNADALCGALARIRAHGEGSRILNWHAEAMAHMLFAADSHPPIEERIRRANPHVPPAHYLQRPRLPEKPRPALAPKVTPVSVLVASMGEPTPESLRHAAGLLAYLPIPIGEALADSFGAQAVMLGCLIDADLTVRSAQARAIGDDNLARKSEVLAPIIAGLDRAYRLPLVALALPVLRNLDGAGRAKFLDIVRAVIQADRRVTLSEFVFITILEAHLTSRPGPGSVACGAASAECALVLSLLAHAGSDAAGGFEKGRTSLGVEGAFRKREDLRLDEVSGALARLRELAPAEKGRFVAACAEVTTADGEVRLAEHELLRAVCSSLDCPMPQALAALDERLLRK